jgi:hypothetical protein
MLCGHVPGRALECPPLCRRPEPGSQVAVERKPPQRLRKSVHVAGLHEESFTPVLCQIREVASTPPDDWESECHRLPPDRPVRLTSCGKYEYVGCRIEGRDVLRWQRPVPDDAEVEVSLGNARPHARPVPRLGRLLADEVKGSRLSGNSCERVEELEDPFPRQPVGDGEERGSAPFAKVRGSTSWRRRYVTPRGDDSNLRARQPHLDELIREVLACRNQEVRSSQGEPIEWRLYSLAKGAMVDSAGRLMQHGDHGKAGTMRQECRSGERGGDRVEQQCARPERL